MSDLASRTGYTFVDEALRAQVFSHRSFRHENVAGPSVDNERLEFLGDSILGYLVSRMLFRRFPDKREGELSRLRSHLVSSYHLALKARALELGQDLMLGKGELMSGGRDKDSILADVYESLIAGIFLDGGDSAVADFVEREFNEDISTLETAWPVRDYKSHLQEELHAGARPEPSYRVVGEDGPDHRKTFDVAVFVNGTEVGRGTGSSKKVAQQEAARVALVELGYSLPRGRVK